MMSLTRWFGCLAFLSAWLITKPLPAAERVSKQPMTPPLIECKPLPPFEPTDWISVGKAFADSTPVSFQQGWLKQLEPGFKPTSVRTGWDEHSLWVYAELDDVDIFNPTTKMNEITDPGKAKPDPWFNPISSTAGDVFEIFVRHAEKEPYYELHITPQNQALQLRWPDARAYPKMCHEKTKIDPHVIQGEKVFTSYTKVDRERQKWFVLAAIPAQLVSESESISPNEVWRISFCRYDFTTGNDAPVLSSTSPHAARGFHRLHEWGRLKFGR